MNPPVRVENRANLNPDAFRTLSNVLSHHHNMKRAVDWMAAQDPPIAPAGMVTQDEFSHDILVPAPGGLWTVYDST